MEIKKTIENIPTVETVPDDDNDDMEITPIDHVLLRMPIKHQWQWPPMRQQQQKLTRLMHESYAK